MKSEDAVHEEDQAFFFPKANPPRTVFARSREEAERALQALNRKEA